MHSMCFNIYKQCVEAISSGELIESVSSKDKEFHFQNWFEKRLIDLGLYYETSGRNTYPDFRLVNVTEGYEVKGLAWPGREKDYDANSQVPTGFHNGRSIFYVFGRYPADISQFVTSSVGKSQYPVVDLVICHGDFLNADHEYVHKNRSVKGFGTYGDIMIRDRKMYVAPTPFSLANGTMGLQTLIIPAHYELHADFKIVGYLSRIENDEMVIGYSFDLRNNEIESENITNPNAGTKHDFIACRLKHQSAKPVNLIDNPLEFDNEDE